MDVAALRLKSGEAVRDAEERFVRPKSIAGMEHWQGHEADHSACSISTQSRIVRSWRSRGDQVGPKL